MYCLCSTVVPSCGRVAFGAARRARWTGGCTLSAALVKYALYSFCQPHLTAGLLHQRTQAVTVRQGSWLRLRLGCGACEAQAACCN